MRAERKYILLERIKYFIMDVDGTLTDGKIYMGNGGELFKAFDIKDGCGIHDILITAGIKPIIITGRESKILECRCMELGITEFYQNVHNKLKKLNDIVNKSEYTYANIAYIGDDINDLLCMKAVKDAGGILGCPGDAAEAVKEISDFISSKNGGNGAVREFIEWIVN